MGVIADLMADDVLNSLVDELEVFLDRQCPRLGTLT